MLRLSSRFEGIGSFANSGSDGVGRCTKMCFTSVLSGSQRCVFVSFLSSEFITVLVESPMENELAKCTSVRWAKYHD